MSKNVPPLVEKEWVVCGKKFFPTRRNQVICGDFCRLQRRKDQQREFHERHGNVSDLSPRSCVVCGKTYTPSRGDQKCYSDECRGEWLRQISRKNNLKYYYAHPHEKAPKLKDRVAALEEENTKLRAEIAKIRAIMECNNLR